MAKNSRNLITRSPSWKVLILVCWLPVGVFMVYFGFTRQFFYKVEPIWSLIDFSYPFVLLSMLFIAMMFWSIGVTSGLRSQLPKEIVFEYRIFWIGIAIGMAYPVYYIWRALNGAVQYDTHEILDMLPGIVFLISILYLMIFVTRMIKTVELQRKISMLSMFPECLVLLLYPFGIWILQERVYSIHRRAKREMNELQRSDPGNDFSRE